MSSIITFDPIASATVAAAGANRRRIRASTRSRNGGGLDGGASRYHDRRLLPIPAACGRGPRIRRPGAAIDRHAPFGITPRFAGIARRIARARNACSARRELATDRREAPRILAAIGADRPEAATWEVVRGLAGDPTILSVGPAGSPSAAMVRIARSAATQEGLRHAAAALAAIRATTASSGADVLLPVPIAGGTLDGRAWLAESVLPGRSARTMLSEPAARRRMLTATSVAIGRIHAATAETVVVDDGRVRRWVTDRARVVAAALDRMRPGASSRDRLARVESAVAAEIRGRTVTVGWIHGDLWPANVLIIGDGPDVSGFVDWDSAAAGELPLHDLLHLALTTRRLVERRELGPVAAAVLRGGAWSDDDRAVLGLPAAVIAGSDGSVAGSDGNDAGSGVAAAGAGSHANDAGRVAPAGEAFSGLTARTAVWLYWLRFVESNLARHPALAGDRAWMTANVEDVVACA